VHQLELQHLHLLIPFFLHQLQMLQALLQATVNGFKWMRLLQ
jgi:hypothetical protein